MAKPLQEKWKAVDLGVAHANDFRLEVSNLGRLRSFNKITKGGILKGSQIGGYPVIKIKLYTERNAKVQKKIDTLQAQVYKAAREVKELQANRAAKKDILPAQAKLADIKEKLTATSIEDTDSRVIHYHSLVHRLVAQYFLPKPKANQTVVSHLDFDKANNNASNLRWMTVEANKAHQQNSPRVIHERTNRIGRRNASGGNTQLTVAKVARLKKMLNSNKHSLSTLAAKFGVSDTQIARIRRGENWADVAAAQ